MSVLGDTIRALRKQAGMTQEQLAEAAGIHRVNLAQYETGKVVPGAVALSRIAEALHVSSNILLNEDQMTDADREIWDLREQVRRDPERRILFDLARDADIEDVRQAVAVIDALKKTRRD